MGGRTFAAVDLGASGGRVVAGTIDGDRLQLRTVHRFSNGATEHDGHLRWNLLQLHQEVVRGLDRAPEAETIGLDAWGVDYGLLDADGKLLADPVSHRDDRTAKVIDEVHAKVDPIEMYRINGLQFLPFNTLYQLVAEQRGPLWGATAQVVLIPDLLGYWLTGELRSERTVASTTGLLDVRSLDWSGELLDRLGIAPGLFPPIESPGERRGVTRTGRPVVTVGSHDTASAVVAVPAITDRFAYISCGTWSLVGLELAEPVLSEEARRCNFTNEAGVDGRIRFLRNVGGLWLLQECLRAWGGDDLHGLLAQAARLGPYGPQVDVDDPAFVAPGEMPDRIARAAGAGSATSLGHSGIVRCVLDSLAAAFARTVWEASALSAHPVEVIHMVGGGSRNELLCQLTADAAGMTVMAGPAEATAIGNIVVQARAAGAAPGTLEAIRAQVGSSIELRRYEPS